MEEILDNIKDLKDDVDQNEMRSKLSTMSFADLQKLKSRLGTKLYKEAYYGTKTVKETKFKRLNKNRPREASSKIKPKFNSSKTKILKNVRDPRFDTLCGTFDRSTFDKNYHFISRIREKEKKELKQLLQNEKNEEKKCQIKYLLQRMNNQDREKLRREKKIAKMNEEKKEQIEALKSGKKPHFRSKHERKLGDIVEKYEELKQSGKLLSFIEKKQKKNNKKHKRYFEQQVSDD